MPNREAECDNRHFWEVSIAEHLGLSDGVGKGGGSLQRRRDSCYPSLTEEPHVTVQSERVGKGVGPPSSL